MNDSHATVEIRCSLWVHKEQRPLIHNSAIARHTIASCIYTVHNSTHVCSVQRVRSLPALVGVRQQWPPLLCWPLYCSVAPLNLHSASSSYAGVLHSHDHLHLSHSVCHASVGHAPPPLQTS